ncbi:MAG TPA: allophanate hydrolase [Acidimicrobiia bacterium]|nr:allophanate hydrolase [Acidimicrobiia bacterium]
MGDEATCWSIDAALTATPEDNARTALDRVAASPFPEAWISVVPADELLARARAVGALLADGARLPLAGVPFAVKDNIDVAGMPTTVGVPEFAYVPDRSAPVVERLLAAGAMVVGKTNLDQFATGLVGTRSPVFGACRNPLQPEYVAGGSSSGSAVVVATGQVPFSLGTDTAGSGRVPAALCGIVGLKPTAGLLSTGGVFPAMPSFDCVSVFSASIADAAAVLDVTRRVPAARDSTRPTRVGVPTSIEWLGDDGARARFDAAIARLEALGCAVVEIDASDLYDAGALLYGSALTAERYGAFGAFADAHPDVVHPAIRAILSNARAHSAADVVRAWADLAAARDAVVPMWASVDVLLVPTVARVPTYDEAIGDWFGPSTELGRFTSFVNPLGMSALAVPWGVRDTGVPFGVSFVGPGGADDALLELAARFAGEPARGSGRRPATPDTERFGLVVVGAHLSGQPLNHQLTSLGASLVERTTTAPEYRLFALDTVPPKPGLVRVPGDGAAIEVEVWSLDAEGLGRFVAGIPAPLGVGRVVLADGSEVTGFLCEPHVTAGARDITEFGGWRAFLASLS